MFPGNIVKFLRTPFLKNIFQRLCFWKEIVKGTLSGLRQILVAKSPFKMMKNAFYFTLKAIFILEIFKFLFWLFGHVGKRLDKKPKINSKIYDVTNWVTDSYDTYIARYLKEVKAISQMRNMFFEKSCTKCGRGTSPGYFFKNQHMESALSIFLDEQSQFSYNLFLLYAKVED